MNTNHRKKAKMILKHIFFKLMNNAVFGKNFGKCEKIQRYLNLSQEKEEETIWCQNQIIILHIFLQKIYQQQK